MAPTREQQRVVNTGAWWKAYFDEQETTFSGDATEAESVMPPLDAALSTWLPSFAQPVDPEKTQRALHLLVSVCDAQAAEGVEFTPSLDWIGRAPITSGKPGGPFQGDLMPKNLSSWDPAMDVQEGMLVLVAVGEESTFNRGWDVARVTSIGAGPEGHRCVNGIWLMPKLPVGSASGSGSGSGSGRGRGRGRDMGSGRGRGRDRGRDRSRGSDSMGTMGTSIGSSSVSFVGRARGGAREGGVGGVQCRHPTFRMIPLRDGHLAGRTGRSRTRRFYAPTDGGVCGISQTSTWLLWCGDTPSHRGAAHNAITRTGSSARRQHGPSGWLFHC